MKPRPDNMAVLSLRIGSPDANGCWPWLGCKTGGGYGQVGIDQRTIPVHRLVYELLVGPIPEGLTIDHLCRVRHCVNPAHLEPVTMRENTLRGNGPPAKNARKTHCKRGHELSAENTYTGAGVRECRTCRRVRNLAYYHRRKTHAQA